MLAAVCENEALRHATVGLECNALSAEGLASLRARLGEGGAIDGRFQQPRCAYVNDLAKASGEQGRVAAILGLGGGGGGASPSAGRVWEMARDGRRTGDVAVFLAAAAIPPRLAQNYFPQGEVWMGVGGVPRLTVRNMLSAEGAIGKLASWQGA